MLSKADGSSSSITDGASLNCLTFKAPTIETNNTARLNIEFSATSAFTSVSAFTMSGNASMFNVFDGSVWTAIDSALGIVPAYSENEVLFNLTDALKNNYTFFRWAWYDKDGTKGRTGSSRLDSSMQLFDNENVTLSDVNTAISNALTNAATIGTFDEDSAYYDYGFTSDENGKLFRYTGTNGNGYVSGNLYYIKNGTAKQMLLSGDVDNVDITGKQDVITSTAKLDAAYLSGTLSTDVLPSIPSSKIANASTWNAKMDSPNNVGETGQILKKAATGYYWDTCPDVWDTQITMQVAGTTLNSFTLNQSSNKTINIPSATNSGFGVVKTATSVTNTQATVPTNAAVYSSLSVLSGDLISRINALSVPTKITVTGATSYSAYNGEYVWDETTQKYWKGTIGANNSYVLYIPNDYAVLGQYRTEDGGFVFPVYSSQFTCSSISDALGTKDWGDGASEYLTLTDTSSGSSSGASTESGTSINNLCFKVPSISVDKYAKLVLSFKNDSNTEVSGINSYSNMSYFKVFNGTSFNTVNAALNNTYSENPLLVDISSLPSSVTWFTYRWDGCTSAGVSNSTGETGASRIDAATQLFDVASSTGISQTDLTNALADYVSTTSLATTLNDYALKTSVPKGIEYFSSSSKSFTSTDAGKIFRYTGTTTGKFVSGKYYGVFEKTTSGGTTYTVTFNSQTWSDDHPLLKGTYTATSNTTTVGGNTYSVYTNGTYYIFYASNTNTAMPVENTWMIASSYASTYDVSSAMLVYFESSWTSMCGVYGYTVSENTSSASTEYIPLPIALDQTLIEETTGSSLTVYPGRTMKFTCTGNTTIAADGGASGIWGTTEIDIIPGSYTVSGGSNLTIVDALTANKTNHCIVRWRGTSARLYVVDTE